MSNNFKNKIQAKDQSIKNLLDKQKFFIDYFQREYRWEEKDIKSLVDDLTSTFIKSYTPTDKRRDVKTYQNYYLGPIVFSENLEKGEKSIIDGQQRITSLTLLLIYLNNMLRKTEDKVTIDSLIYSETYGDKSFNMTDPLREPCLKSLFETGEYKVKETDDETVCNMVERYEDITQYFPEDLTQKALPFFVDWLIENVVIVEITAYSDENAYTIFETMNDRGMNLTSTEMLKGYVLSKITDPEQRNEINDIWKTQIQKLHGREVSDQAFFQAWFRGKYAISIRPGKAGSENQDFELIGSRFHSWFKDKHENENYFDLKTSGAFYDYFKNQFPFYVKRYLASWNARRVYDDGIPQLYYTRFWGIADSLYDAMLLASINMGDNDDVCIKKMDYTSRYVETFTVMRAVNYRNFGQTSIKYTMFNLIKLIRNNALSELGENFASEIDGIDMSWDGVNNFGLHGRNRKFVKHLLARISSYIANLKGDKDEQYKNFQERGEFEIEHVVESNFDNHRDEFEHENKFETARGLIGALILLPSGTNQSLGSDKYEKKVKHYLKENVYAQTLHPDFYERNPRFLKSELLNDLQFRPHGAFKKKDIEERTQLVQRICEQLWSTDYFFRHEKNNNS